MNKKKGLKLGVASLLVGVTALTACGKKTNKKPTNTTSNKVVSTTTKKPTSKKTTEQNNTTVNQKVATSYNIYIDDALLSDTNNVIKVEYGIGYNYMKHIKAEVVYDDNSTEALDASLLDFETNLTKGANVGTYKIKVNYLDFGEKEISLVVEPKKLDFSGVKFEEVEHIYSGSDHSVKLINLPTKLDVFDIAYTGNKSINAGTYHATATITSNNSNFVVENVPDCISNYEWTIKKQEATLEVSNPSKVFDNKVVDIKYTTNAYINVDVLYKKRGASDDTYSFYAPKDAGSYTATIIVGTNDNITGVAKVIDFDIYKGTIKFPTLNKTRTTYNGSEQSLLDILDGFDADLMELSSDSPDVVQTNAGSYVYEILINNDNIDNFDFYGAPTDNKIKWTIQNSLSEYVDSITCNGENVSISDFENSSNLFIGNAYAFTMKEGYKVYFNSNYKETAEFTINSLIDTIEIYYLSNPTPIYINDFFADYHGIGSIEVNGELYKVFDYATANKNDRVYFDRSNGNTINIKLNGVSSSITSIYYKDDNNSNVEIIDNPNINIDMSKKSEFKLYYRYNNKDYTIIITEKKLIERLRIKYYDLESETVSYKEFDYVENYLGYMDNINLEDNQVVIDIEPVFSTYFDGLNYRLYDRGFDHWDIDFTHFRKAYGVKIACFNNDSQIAEYSAYIYAGDMPNYPVTNTYNGYYYAHVSNNSYTVPSYHNTEVYIDGVKSTDRIINLDEKGVSSHLVEYKFTVNGFTYVFEAHLVIVYSDNVSDYATDAGFFCEVYGSTEESQLTNNNIVVTTKNHYTIDIDEANNITSDSLFAVVKAGYTFNSEKTTFGFYDLDESYPNYYIKYVFEKDGEEYYAYVLVGYRGEYKNNAKIVNEQVIARDTNGNAYYYDIVNDEVTLYDYNYGAIKFNLEDKSCNVKLYRNNSITSMYEDSDGYYWFYPDAGTFKLEIKTRMNETRIITINIIETDVVLAIARELDEDKKSLYLDDSFEGNMYVRYPMMPGDSFKVTGYFGDSNYIIDDSYIDLELCGGLVDSLYKDPNELVKVKNKDRFDVYYDENGYPYIVMYSVSNSQLVTFTIYLSGKPKVKGNKIILGTDEYSIKDFSSFEEVDPKEYIINNGDLTNTLTLSLTEKYDDYSYAIIMTTEENINNKTVDELEELNVIYRITDANTLTIDIPLTQEYFYIAPLGTTKENLLNDVELIWVQKNMLYNIEIGQKNYYHALVFERTGWGNLYMDEKNGNGQSNFYPPFIVSDYITFYLGEDEQDNTIDNDGIETYKFKINLGLGVKLCDVFENEYVLDENGMLELPIEIDEVEFIVKYYNERLDSTIYIHVKLVLDDEGSFILI